MNAQLARRKPPDVVHRLGQHEVFTTLNTKNKKTTFIQSATCAYSVVGKKPYSIDQTTGYQSRQRKSQLPCADPHTRMHICIVLLAVPGSHDYAHSGIVEPKMSGKSRPRRRCGKVWQKHVRAPSPSLLDARNSTTQTSCSCYCESPLRRHLDLDAELLLKQRPAKTKISEMAVE
jgi:hypothetical protein